LPPLSLLRFDLRHAAFFRSIFPLPFYE
jgi:hypothetical protein